jgi:hypothetical protein
MKPSDRARERVRCKIDYAPKNAGQSVKMNVRCASDAYKMDLNANIDQNGTALSGNWFESSIARAARFRAKRQRRVSKPKSRAIPSPPLLTVRTRGNRQTFVMDSPGAWVSHVSIDLVRDPR